MTGVNQNALSKPGAESLLAKPAAEGFLAKPAAESRVAKPGTGALVLQDRDAHAGENKTVKPIGLGEISKTAEITKEVGMRVVDIAKIAVKAPHNPVAALISGVGLMSGAVALTSGIAGAFEESPAIQIMKGIGTGGSVAATVVEAGVAHELLLPLSALGAGSYLGVASVGLGAFTLTDVALKATASTKVGAYLGGGYGEHQADIMERYPQRSGAFEVVRWKWY